MEVGQKVKITRDILDFGSHATKGTIATILEIDGNMYSVGNEKLKLWIHTRECISLDKSEQTEPSEQELRKRLDKAMTKALGF